MRLHVTYARRSRTIPHSKFRPANSDFLPPERHRRPDLGRAFVPDPEGVERHVPDDLAETLAEVYLRSATSGEEQAAEVLNDFVPEEAGGPFVEEDVAPDLDLEVPAARSATLAEPLWIEPGRFLAFGRRRG